MLIFLYKIPPQNNQRGLALYKCSYCGKTTIAEQRKVKNGRRNSCGCKRRKSKNPLS